MEAVKVQKRGGGVEDWSSDKLINSMAKAGISVTDAERVSKEVQAWAEQNAANGIVTSNQIRDRVTEVLKNQFPVEADSYVAYKKE